MEFHIYVGGFQTAHQHLSAQLQANQELLAEHKIHFPDSDQAKALVSSAARALTEGADLNETREKLMEELSGGTDWARIVIVHPGLIGSLTRQFSKDLLHPRSANYVHGFTNPLVGSKVRLFAETRNPSNYIPASYLQQLLKSPEMDFKNYIADRNAWDLRWSEYLHRVNGVDPDDPITTWAFEDYPYIWRTVVQAFTGIPNKEDLVEAEAEFDPGLSLTGAIVLQKYLEENGAQTRTDLQKVLPEFLKRYPRVDGEIVPNLWPEELITHLSHAYEDDMYYVDRADNIVSIRRPAHSLAAQ